MSIPNCIHLSFQPCGAWISSGEQQTNTVTNGIFPTWRPRQFPPLFPLNLLKIPKEFAPNRRREGKISPAWIFHVYVQVSKQVTRWEWQNSTFRHGMNWVRTTYGIFIPLPSWICPCTETSGSGFSSEPLKAPGETLEGIPAPMVVLPKGPEVWNDINLLPWDLCPWLLGSMAPESPEGSHRLAGIRDGKAPSRWVAQSIRWPRDFPDSPAPRALSCFGSPQVKGLPPFHHSHWETIPKLHTFPQKYFLESASNFFSVSFLLETLILGNPSAPTSTGLGSRVSWDVWVSV